MAFHQIKNPNGQNNYHIQTFEDFEYKVPLEKIREITMQHNFFTYKVIMSMQKVNVPMATIRKLMFNKAYADWLIEYQKFKAIELPNNLVKLLDSQSKQEQIQLLKGLTLDTMMLVSFILLAGEKGYTFSQYKSSHHQNGLDKNQLPTLVEVQGGNVNVIGKTSYSDGKLKQVVQHRTVKVSKFIDKGDNWHCFFLTYKSLGGKENYKGGQAHLHYISNYWTIPREEVVKQLNNKHYNLPSFHVDFNRNR